MFQRVPGIPREETAHIAPWFSHEARDDTMAHANALGQVFEQNGVVCHTRGTLIRQCSLKDARARLCI
jgi:hypothetical protein